MYMTEKTSTNVHMLTLGDAVPMLSMLFESHRELDETDDSFALSTNIELTTRGLKSESSKINTIFLGMHPRNMHRVPEETLDVIAENKLLVLTYEHYVGKIPTSVANKVNVVPISTNEDFAKQIEDALLAHQSSLATEQAAVTAIVPDGKESSKAKGN